MLIVLLKIWSVDPRLNTSNLVAQDTFCLPPTIRGGYTLFLCLTLPPPLRALILNAAFQEATTQTLTEDKRDMTFAVNYLANFLLVLLLLRSMDEEYGRIVFVSSWSHNPTDPRTFGTIWKGEVLVH